MEYLRPIDWEKASARFEGGYRGQFLWYSESCAVIATRIPPGVSGPPRHTHTSDQIYFLVDGELEIDLGTDTVTAPQHSGVLIPAGTPHQNRNVSDDEVVLLEVLAPGIRPGQPLVTMTDDADAGDRGYYVREPTETRSAGGMFTMSWLANRESGSLYASTYLAEIAPGGAGPSTHIHAFDQFYFVVDGELNVEVALQHHVVRPRTLVVLPAGVPHRQWNEGQVPERHLAILAPEPDRPMAEEPWDVRLDVAVAG